MLRKPESSQPESKCLLLHVTHICQKIYWVSRTQKVMSQSEKNVKKTGNGASRQAPLSFSRVFNCRSLVDVLNVT